MGKEIFISLPINELNSHIEKAVQTGISASLENLRKQSEVECLYCGIKTVCKILDCSPPKARQILKDLNIEGINFGSRSTRYVVKDLIKAINDRYS